MWARSLGCLGPGQTTKKKIHFDSLTAALESRDLEPFAAAPALKAILLSLWRKQGDGGNGKGARCPVQQSAYPYSTVVALQRSRSRQQLQGFLSSTVASP